MKVEQLFWNEANGWDGTPGLSDSAQLVVVFGSRQALENAERFGEVKRFYPNAAIVSGSTSGEIIDVEVHDRTLVATAVALEKSTVKTAGISLEAGADSHALGKALAEQFDADGLKHLFVVSDGLNVNGTALVNGMHDVLPAGVSITGGLAGDGADFGKTVVGLDEPPSERQLVGIGFYGEALKVGYSSVGGWQPFGAERTVTRSEANVLHELDGKPALELYKTYLGDKATELPAAALLFPLSVKATAEAEEVVRTILTIDEAKQTMTFAGDVPQGATVRLMKSNFEGLVDSAQQAAERSLEILETRADLAFLVSCVGRKLVLNQRIEDEVEGVREIIGEASAIAGFYSYGELAPSRKGERCLLHNQTMTITLLSES